MDLKKLNSILLSGDLYDPTMNEIIEYQLSRIEMVNEYNKTESSIEGLKRRTNLLKNMFRKYSNGYIEPPFHANFGGLNVDIGLNVYANFNLTLVDDGEITIGDYTMIGPNVIIATAGHPVLPELREKMYQYNAPVHIGRNCWIGAGSIILPGVTIGDNVVIGAGSVVTKDIESNVVAVGNPCKVLRQVGEKDKEFYFKDRKIDIKE